MRAQTAQRLYDERVTVLQTMADRLSDAIASLRDRDINGNWGHAGDLGSAIARMREAVEAVEIAEHSAGFLSRKGN